jgi:hypothetical protein
VGAREEKRIGRNDQMRRKLEDGRIRKGGP